VKCPKCSADNPETQRFCGGCGTSLIIEGDQDVPTETFKIPVIELTTGSIFAGRYQIVEELGAGGMGRVYRAIDQTLGEEIAIKFVRPEIATDEETIQRFRIELRAARQVVHKNVARMFDLNEEAGIPYITMEYVRGENLRRLIKKMGRLSSAQAVSIAIQVAGGLDAAHRLGVIHRDLKPQNIMIDEDGEVRIMDFGLARLPRAEEKTEPGFVLGTPAYVSPEHVEGKPIDGRSDLYSLGIVLFEMLTGKPPFQAADPASLALKHVISVPPDPRTINADIPESLSRIVLKCLEKDREKRYRDARELVSDLSQVEEDLMTGKIAELERRPGWKEAGMIFRSRRLVAIVGILAVLAAAGYVVYKAMARPGGGLRRNAIAVLPVEDRSPQKDQERLCYGLQKDIADKLFSIPGLRVLPLLSVAGYSYAGKNARQIGRDLEVDFLLQLALQVEGEKLRVTADLIDTAQNVVLQPFRLERRLENFFAVQDEISRYISQALKFRLVEDRLGTIKMREPRNLEAYNAYLDGMKLIEDVYHLTYRREDFEAAIRLYQKAIEMDPEYALAFWGMGNAYEALYNSGTANAERPELLDKMLECYWKAYHLNPDFAETNLGLGWTYFYRADNDKAFQFFKRAVELEPKNPLVNLDVGAFLRSIGLYERAILYFRRASQLNPADISPHVLIASCCLHLGEARKAGREVEKALVRVPGSLSARIYYAVSLLLMNEQEAAQKELEIARKISPNDPRVAVTQTLAWAAEGKKDQALEFVRRQEVLTFQGTYIYLFLGMKSEAINNIERGIEKGFERYGEYLYSYPSLVRTPLWRELKGEPRFREILKREKIKYKEKLRKFGRL